MIVYFILSTAALLGASATWYFAGRCKKADRLLLEYFDHYGSRIDHLSSVCNDTSLPIQIKDVDSLRKVKVIRCSTHGDVWVVLKEYQYHNSWSRQTALVEAEEFVKLIKS